MNPVPSCRTCAQFRHSTTKGCGYSSGCFSSDIFSHSFCRVIGILVPGMTSLASAVRVAHMGYNTLVSRQPQKSQTGHSRPVCRLAMTCKAFARKAKGQLKDVMSQDSVLTARFLASSRALLATSLNVVGSFSTRLPQRHSFTVCVSPPATHSPHRGQR